MNQWRQVLFFLIVLLGIPRIFSFSTYPETDDRQFYADFNEDYAIYSPPLPENLEFSGQSIPLDDPEIYEHFERELLVNTYWQSQTLLFLKRAHRYLPRIEEILAEEGIPQDFKYLPLIESGLRNVVSPAGAVGYWQIMEATGKAYGLEINQAVDERYHLEKATRAACGYLRDAKAELGSWPLAAAAYNRGLTGIKKEIARQKARDFFELKLNPETARYLYRLLAVKTIMENPRRYGFRLREKDLYAAIPTYTVAVDTAIEHFDAFNRRFGINYRILKYHNPWLRYEYLPANPGKTYHLRLPRQGGQAAAKPYPSGVQSAKDSL